MLAPIGRLKKAEILWLSKHRCKHKHTFLEHYSCYLKEVESSSERLGFFDIEASGLQANFAIMLCYCIKEAGSDKIYQYSVTKKELDTCLDKNVVRRCIEDLSKFDKIITFYGSRFDFPFVRTRALVNNIDFPEYGQLFHNDLYYNIRYKFKLHSNRLENACRVLLGKTEKTHVDPNIWLKALRGSKKELDWILDHCQRDVRDLERLYDKVHIFKGKANTSI